MRTDATIAALNSALDGRYRVERVLGEGGMATVFLAEELRHGRRVALKVLRPELAAIVGADRFLAEIKTTASLQHPHVLALYDSGEADGHLYYAMPYVDGETLRDRLQREGQLPVEEAIRIVTDVAEALDYAHRKGVVHRDVKPANILLFDGKAVVADFGIALAVSASGGERLTETGLSLGTTHYMSPEQAMGDERVGPATDVYALGCVLFELLAGEPPFTAGSPQATLAKILAGGSPSVRQQRPTAPAHVDAVITKALQKVPADRFASADDFRRALAEPGLASVDATAGDGAPIAWGAPRARFGIGLTAVSVAAVAVAGLLSLEGRSGEGASAGGIRSIAVLPFENLMEDEAEQYFVDGMTEQLITELAKVGGLTVIARTSVMRYRDSDLPVPDIARELGVDAVVEGSVLRAGQRVRITARLSEASAGNSLWADSYDRALGDVLELHADVARSVVSEVSVLLTPEDERRLAASGSVVPEAYEAYLRGRFWWNRRTDEGFRNAIASFEEAMELDSAYAPAYAGLADAHGLMAYYGTVPPREGYSEAIGAARQAIELDDRLAAAHTSLGGALLFYEWDWEGAEREFRRAIELNPGYATAHHWYWALLSVVGRMDEAWEHIARARELDPFSLIINRDLGKHHYFSRDYDRAVEALRETLAIDSNFFLAHWYLGKVHERAGRFTEAIESYERSVALSGRSPIQLGALGHALARAGNETRAREIVVELERLRATRYVDPFAIAEVYLALGDRDAAFRWFDRAHEERSVYLIYLVRDPRYDEIRSDSRFIDLVARMGLAG